MAIVLHESLFNLNEETADIDREYTYSMVYIEDPSFYVLHTLLPNKSTRRKAIQYFDMHTYRHAQIYIHIYTCVHTCT